MGWRNILALILTFLAMYLSVSQFFVREQLVSKVFAILYFLFSLVIVIAILTDYIKQKSKNLNWLFYTSKIELTFPNVNCTSLLVVSNNWGAVQWKFGNVTKRHKRCYVNVCWLFLWTLCIHVFIQFLPKSVAATI